MRAAAASLTSVVSASRSASRLVVSNSRACCSVISGVTTAATGTAVATWVVVVPGSAKATPAPAATASATADAPTARS